MRLAITTAFYPSIGGIETVANLLAHEFVAAKHEVVIIATNEAPKTAERRFPFSVHYRPRANEVAAIYRGCDCVLQFNLGMKSLWPNLLVGRPVVVSHQGIYDPTSPGTTISDRAKHWANGLFRKIAASGAVARRLRGETTVIPNCYDAECFSAPATEVPARDLICVARLIWEKGVDLLIDAVAELRARGVSLTATIVGGGPLLEPLKKRADNRGVAGQVEFVGPKKAAEVAALYRRHRIAVVPSRYEEAFGIVALEAIACGCHVIAANRGGLPEAVGGCGSLFEHGSVEALREAIVGAVSKLQTSPHGIDRKMVTEHLFRHSPAVVAAQYLAVLQNACPNSVQN